MTITRRKARQELVRDLFFVLIGIAIAGIMSGTGALEWLLTFFGGEIIASFVAGIFFTSIITVAPAAVVLAKIAEHTPYLQVAIFGGLGAMFGDLLIFLFIRDRLSEDIMKAFKPKLLKHIISSFHFGFLKWLAPIVGALFIALPLPNEIGLTLLGVSRINTFLLIPLSFILNAVGILTIIWLNAQLI